MYEDMNEENFRDYAKKALELRKQGLYDEACGILKLILQKGAAIFEDELHYKMATYYYQMGIFSIFIAPRRYFTRKSRELR